MRQQREILGVVDLESSGDHQRQHEELVGIDRAGLSAGTDMPPH